MQAPTWCLHVILGVTSSSKLNVTRRFDPFELNQSLKNGKLWFQESANARAEPETFRIGGNNTKKYFIVLIIDDIVKFSSCSYLKSYRDGISKKVVSYLPDCLPAKIKNKINFRRPEMRIRGSFFKLSSSTTVSVNCDVEIRRSYSKTYLIKAHKDNQELMFVIG